MGDIEETYLKSDEAIPLSSSQATSKAYTFGCEVSYIEPHAKLSNSWFHEHTWMGPLMSISRTAPLMSIYKVLINTKINILLPFGPLAILLHYLTGKHGWVFIFSLLGIAPLAERLGYATEQLAFYTGPTGIFIVLIA
ncbi:hypothetical protein CsSME_00051890 [Camellia sinensis var. sinensis]